jgi:glycosyltransferase involved in cell wall biosynthesis
MSLTDLPATPQSATPTRHPPASSANAAVSAMIINGRFMTRPATGVDRFALELLNALSANGPALTAWVPAQATVRSELPERLKTRPVGRLTGQAWEQWDLPRLAGDAPLINLCNTGPLLRREQLVVIHDTATLANPGNFSWKFRAWYQVMLSSLMKRSKVITSVSKFSAGELMRYFPNRRSGVEVVCEGGEHILRVPADTRIIDRLKLHGRRFVLAVGNRSTNKNFGAVLKAMALLDDPDLLLVAAGGGNQRVFASAQVEDPRLLSTGFVSDAELRALYEHAECFIFPSFYEGFGLPPLEAMCCGCPVVASNTSSMPEVCGDAALYCDPADPASIATHIRRLLDSPALCDEMREAGLARSRLYGWDKAAAQFQDIMKANFA